MAGEATQVIPQSELWSGGRSPFSVSYGKMMMWFFLISDALTFSGLLVSLGFMKHKYNDVWPVSEQVFTAFPFCGHTHLPLLYVALMTFILIVSSVTMVLAVEAGHRMDKSKVRKWLFFTVLGGLFFLFSQVWEWSHFIHGTENGALRTEAVSRLADGTVVREGTVIQWLNEEKTELRLPWKDVEGNYITVSGTDASKIISGSKPVFGASLHENEYGVQLYADFFFFVTGFHGFHVFSGVCINLIILILVIKGVCQARGHYELVEKTGLYWHFVDLVWVFVFTFYYLL